LSGVPHPYNRSLKLSSSPPLSPTKPPPQPPPPSPSPPPPPRPLPL